MSKILSKGHLSILDAAFKYTPSMRTDVSATFHRIRAELKAKQQAEAAALAAAATHKPIPFARGKHGR